MKLGVTIFLQKLRLQHRIARYLFFAVLIFLAQLAELIVHV